MPSYRVTHNVKDIEAVDVPHQLPATRGTTRYSDLTGSETKQIILEVAKGNLHTMSRKTGIRSTYFVNIIKGYFTASWSRADIIRGTTTTKENTMPSSSKTVDYDLSHLPNEDLRKQVATGLANGEILKCKTCSRLYLKHKLSCPDCKKSKPKAPVETKKVNIVTCKNPECASRFPSWRGKIYCKATCRNRMKQVVRDRAKAAEALIEALNKKDTQTPVEPAQKPQEPATAIDTSKLNDGSKCPMGDCPGILLLKLGTKGRFLGCSYYSRRSRKNPDEQCFFTMNYYPQAPVVNKDIGEKILLELRKINGELSDCIGRVVELENLFRGNNELVACTRKELSSLDDKVDEILTGLKEYFV